MTPGMGKRLFYVITIAFVALTAGNGCKAIKIESGGQEAVALSEVKAKKIQVQWARQIENATPRETVLLLKQLIDTSAARLLYLGEQFAKEWRRGNVNRGEDIPDTRMREVIAATTERDIPIFQAWEDNIDFAWRKLKKSNEISDTIMDKINQMINQYDRVYSVVMFPNGTVRDYEDNIFSVAGEMQSLSRFLEADLGSFR